MRTTRGCFGSGEEEEDDDEEFVAVVAADAFLFLSVSEAMPAPSPVGRARFRQTADTTSRQRRVSETSGTAMTRARGMVSAAM